VSYEAEAATLAGSARVTSYDGASGGRIVRNLGAWHGREGTLRFAVTAPDDGQYEITFFYVYLNDDTGQSVVVTVSGAGPIAVTATGGSSCCASQAVVLALRRGPNAITFGNPNGAAPSLDRIVIQAH
jgi:VCBS repeat-containing protein